MSWRSLLYVPANNPRFLDRAQERGADALILDLEDSVPADRKEEARAMLAARWEGLARGPSDLLVRIGGDLRAAARDLEAAVRPGLAGLYCAKTESPDRIRWIAEAVAELEAERGLPAGRVLLVPLLESPLAVEAAFEIAAADPRVAALTLGSEDYAAALGVAPTPENLFPARHRIVAAARSSGRAALGLLDSVAALGTGEGDFAALVARSRAAGFSGASAVHPMRIPLLNRGFLPDAAEEAWARAVLAALDAAEAQGRGAARLGGRMIDPPMRRRAEQILAQAARR